MDSLTLLGIVSVLAATGLLIWMRRYYSREISRLQGEVKLFKNANEYQDEAVVVFSTDYKVLSANRAARKLLQLDPFVENTKPPKEIYLQLGHSESIPIYEVIENHRSASKGTIRLEKVKMTIDDAVEYVNIYIDHSKWNVQNSIICVLQDAMRDIREEENFKKLGELDFLTELPGQFKALSDINKMVISAQRESKKIALYVFGINEFESIKTTFGLGYVNSVLRKIAEFFVGQEKENAFAYRIDGDNFLYIVENVTDSEEEALARAKEISKKMSRFLISSNKNLNLTFSIGVALFPDHGRNANKLIDHAYRALSMAQINKDGNVAIFRTELNQVREEEIILIDEIKAGLQKKEFQVYYQPIINLKTMQVHGAEALVRWNHPRFGMITPEKFIHIAETSGLVVKIGEFVLEEVIFQQKRWDELGFKAIEVSINISARELIHYQLGEKLEQLFIDHKVDPHYFNLDMSESDAVEDPLKTEHEFTLLKKIGVNLSLDHFGVGGSSIEQLQKLPIHVFKIDRSLLNKIDEDKNHQETVRAIVVLAHALGIEVVAEGIEAKEQYTMLQKLGCDYAQGYIFSKPAPAFEFQALLRK